MNETPKWNDGLEPIEPMSEYCAREMGQLAGRLMTALSLMVDLEDSYGWGEQSAQARETVHTSRLLVASVLRIVAAAQAEQDDEMNMAQAIEDALKRLSNSRNGGEALP